MRCQDILDKIEARYPRKYACDWDNVGLLAGSREREVDTVYIALDATDEVVDAASECGAQLLLTHHPMIFGGPTARSAIGIPSVEKMELLTPLARRRAQLRRYWNVWSAAWRTTEISLSEHMT